jgi:hypothetical protein
MAKTKSTKSSELKARNPKPRRPSAELNGDANGTPKASRNNLCSEYLDTMHALFREGGEKALRKVMEENPAQFMRAIGDLMPKEFGVAEESAGGWLGVWEALGRASKGQ